MNKQKILYKLNKLFFGKKIKWFNALLPFINNKVGLEIGGPSKIFASTDFLPFYKYADRIDGCNFANKTVWEGSIKAGQHYNYTTGKVGQQFIAEASDLSFIENEKYDFVISSHCLEHCANVLSTIMEWKRVIKPNGILTIVVPNKLFTFDKDRAYTTFEHLQADFEQQITEHDLSHLDEIIKHHNLSMDKDSGSPEQFFLRSSNNFENRCLHHHVFSKAVLYNCMQFANLNILYYAEVYPYHMIIVACKSL
jgi:SAM-dependent methyltransferase